MGLRKNVYDFCLKLFVNLTQLISHFACLNLRESKCSKQQDGNFINNCTPCSIPCFISLDY
jgi:hypothetical protein